MAFFGSMMGGGMGPSLGGAPSASAFTSPGLNPSSLAALLTMQGGAGGPPGGPQLPPVPAAGAGGGPPHALGAITPPAGAAPNAGPGQAANPMLMQILMRLFGGNDGAPGSIGGGPTDFGGGSAL